MGEVSEKLLSRCACTRFPGTAITCSEEGGRLGFSWNMVQRHQPHSEGKKGTMGRKALHNRSQPLSRAPDGKVRPAPGSWRQQMLLVMGGGGLGVDPVRGGAQLPRDYATTRSSIEV